MKKYRRGEDVEVMSKEAGFKGSHFEAVVISPLVLVNNGYGDQNYVVQYRTLQTDDTRYRGPLREIRSHHEIRPSPPLIDAPIFNVNDKIDAYYNDGWWVGKIHDVKGSQYFVYFDYTDELIAFLVDDLRPHQDWVDDQWVVSRKRGRPKKNQGEYTGYSRNESEKYADRN